MQWQGIQHGLVGAPFDEAKSCLSNMPVDETSEHAKAFATGLQATPSESYLMTQVQPEVASSFPMESMFPMTGNFPAMPPSFTSNDLQRSSSQPAKTRRDFSPGDFSMSHNSRDTLYAHEFLKAFRARVPESVDRQAACDYCRKRKIKVCCL